MTAAIAMPPVTERPILFSGAMVNAILSGQKTMTRRVVSIANSLVNGDSPSKRSTGLSGWPDLDFSKAWVDGGPSPAGNPGPYLKVPGGDESVQRVYSRIQTGDRLWVRETWRTYASLDYLGPGKVGSGAGVQYEAGGSNVPRHADLLGMGKIRPSIFMPRWASRITLEVTAVRPERVQDISEGDAKSEGVRHLKESYPSVSLDQPIIGRTTAGDAPYGASFAVLWDTINDDRAGCSWLDNPWCHVIEFKVVK